jgi:hypothetical protein
MKSINKRTLFWTTMLFVLLLIPSFLRAWAEDEGTLGTNIIWVLFAKLFNIFRFPTHILFWPIISKCGVIIYFLGLFINCIFYGLLTERTINIFKSKKFEKFV